jgi:NAD(P)-dependent dehydrogenase (short-subunit alcohol dehydrogenase family)
VESTRYRIAVRGRLTGRLASAFEGFALEPSNEHSVLADEIRDQAHLYRTRPKVRRDDGCLAATISERLDHLDVLINNAGVISAKRLETVDGNELTFAVNYLAPFLLTNKLLPLLKRSEAARILAITAAVEPFGRFPWGDLQRARHYGGLRAYAQSKRALAMYTIELARRLRADDSGVTANVVDPFLVRTALTRADDVPLLFKLARPLMIQPQTAARWVASASVDERFAATTGRHIMFGRPAPSPPASRSQRTAGRLWNASAAATEPGGG